MSVPREEKTMLIAFDGSTEARHALNRAAAVLAPRRVEVITAWEPMYRQAARASSMTGNHQADWPAPAQSEDPAYTAALATCREGVALAEELGLWARAHLVESATSTWPAILDAAAELRPDVIVAGARGVSGLRSLWQISTTSALLKNSGIPLFIVPPADADGAPDAPQAAGSAGGSTEED
ncbi:universal stress protein [Corynebacterium atypicum]|uniref:universal stress protein n=1 Tax=Corynebacterium atypicum TaxID=191610 RepID=UPI000689A38C|nr:universal stress protein [Corynebacterium atypicum]